MEAAAATADSKESGEPGTPSVVKEGMAMDSISQE